MSRSETILNGKDQINMKIFYTNITSVYNFDVFLDLLLKCKTE